jgi:hypothetical protein
MGAASGRTPVEEKMGDDRRGRTGEGVAGRSG